MNEFIDLSDDEIHLLKKFRNGARLDRARIMLATHNPETKPTEKETQLLEFFALYMDCNKYGRSRCVEMVEIFSKTSSIEEAHEQLAKIEEKRIRCNVVDIDAYRP